MNRGKAFPAFFIPALFALPFPASAQVIISEIAWMGTAASANDEWIELRNTGSEAASLDGWILSTEDGGISAALTGSLPAGGFYLLERTDDSTLPNITADAFYTGALSNSGETLVLKDGAGKITDRVDMSAGWSAGDNGTKDTMQRVGGAWATGAPTPKAENRASATAPSAADSPDSSDPSGVSSSVSSSGYSAHKNTAIASVAKTKGDLEISISRDRIIPAGSEARFTASARDKSGEVVGAEYHWSWGDGAKSQGNAASHVYKYSGDYVVVLNVVSDGRAATARAAVKVFSAGISLAFGEENGVRTSAILNSSPYEINLGRYALRSGTGEFYFPDDTIIPAKGKLILDEEMTGLSFAFAPLSLIDHSGKSISISAQNGHTDTGVLKDVEEKLLRVLSEARSIESTLKSRVLYAVPVTAGALRKGGYASDTEGTGEEGEEGEEGKLKTETVVVEKPENLLLRIFHFFFRKKEVQSDV